MKKIVCILILTLGFVCLAGCSNKTEQKDFSYTIKETKIVPGTDFASALKELGEPATYTEAASCYFDGMDKVYTYDGFEITTYPLNGKDYILSLQISNTDMKTDKGIGVGSTINDVTTAYGDNYTLVGKMYRYDFEDKDYMYFFIMDDAVKYFGYAIDAEN